MTDPVITIGKCTGPAPEFFRALPDLRWAVDSRSDAHPVLQQAWMGSLGTIEWQTVPSVVVE